MDVEESNNIIQRQRQRFTTASFNTSPIHVSQQQQQQEDNGNNDNDDVTNDITSQLASNTILRTFSILLGALYILHEMQFLGKVLHSSKVKQEWLKIGLVASMAILALKTYIEMFMGKVKKIRVEYKNFKHETHFILALLMIASISFHVALTEAFGGFWRTVLMLDVLFGYGVLLQLMLLIPTYAQNLLFGIVMTWFIQEKYA